MLKGLRTIALRYFTYTGIFQVDFSVLTVEKVTYLGLACFDSLQMYD